MQNNSQANNTDNVSANKHRSLLRLCSLPLTLIALMFILLGLCIACICIYHAYYFVSTPNNIQIVLNYLVGEDSFHVQWLFGEELKRIEIDSSIRLFVAAITFSFVLTPIYASIGVMVKAGTDILAFIKNYENSIR